MQIGYGQVAGREQNLDGFAWVYRLNGVCHHVQSVFIWSGILSASTKL